MTSGCRFTFCVALVKHLDTLPQDQQPLEETMTLVEQCVQGEGLVQINVEIKVAETVSSRMFTSFFCVCRLNQEG